METDFLALCGGDALEFAALRRHADEAGRSGRSFELRGCRMPPGCVPAASTVGFWRHKAQYYLYLNPVVDYRGRDGRLRRFFARGFQQFSSFDALAAALQALAHQAAPAEGDLPPLLRRLRERLGDVVLGQDAAVEAVAFRLYGHIGKDAPKRPLSLIFHGPTGVGKSELGKGIARVLDGLCGEGTYQFVWTELNTFTEAHSVYRLTGAPPGYVGYQDEPVFAAVRRNPQTVFMFDELEKAHPEVLKVFMSILDEGRCTANREAPDGDRELDFRRCILVFTTNWDLTGSHGAQLGFSQPQEAAPQPPPCAADTPAAALACRLFAEDEAARRAMVRSGALREIAGRFSGFVGFRPLDHAARTAITARQITALGREYGLDITAVDPALSQALTPRDALSVRSSVGVLEGALTPLFLDQGRRLRGIPLRLEGGPASMRLQPSPASGSSRGGTSSSVIVPSSRS
ncbi:MAG: ATP-dependent Clp protease ATP-binding subunit [Oscillospiraceae bacterium]|nr:ATP-dependent Clp protease ATP-binding subunit [Oscillospiraceae bacterium]